MRIRYISSPGYAGVINVFYSHGRPGYVYINTIIFRWYTRAYDFCVCVGCRTCTRRSISLFLPISRVFDYSIYVYMCLMIMIIIIKTSGRQVCHTLRHVKTRINVAYYIWTCSVSVFRRIIHLFWRYIKKKPSRDSRVTRIKRAE